MVKIWFISISEENYKEKILNGKVVDNIKIICEKLNINKVFIFFYLLEIFNEIRCKLNFLCSKYTVL